MNEDRLVKLNNGETIEIVATFKHYKNEEIIEYLIRTNTGEKYIITQHELLKLKKKNRTTKEKIILYKEYFSGRLDVYAQKWSNGKGYSPALKNWWDFYQARNDERALSQLVKEYEPYSDKTVYDQIVNNDPYHRYGIYPLLKDNCTNLLVFDFDQHKSSDPDSREIVKALIKICRKYRIDCLPEISHSGKGYHVWIFFDHVLAENARKLGTLLLLNVLESTDLNLDSFDRMIPNQDSLDKGGFGNLIALPLKWEDVQEKRSIFTDDNLHPTNSNELFDQLALMKKYSKEEVEQLIGNISHDMGLIIDGNLLSSLKQANTYPHTVSGYIAGEIFIEKADLTHKEELTLLSLATFSNPEYTKKQRMRMPTWNTPSLITLSTIDRKYLRLPRGCLAELTQKCKCKLKEKFSTITKLDVDFMGSLRKNQQLALNKVLSNSLSMICGHTGFGKTVVSFALIAKRKVPTVIIVPTKSIAKQWQEKGRKFLKISNQPFMEFTPTGRKVSKNKIEIITGSRNHPSKLVDIITIQKLGRMTENERIEFFKDYNQVIVDECHHIAAVTFEKILASANCRYIVGLTATPQRKDGLEKILHLRLGPIVYQDDGKLNTENIFLHRYLYPRYTEIRRIDNLQKSYTQKINELIINHDRNELIVKDVKKCLKDRRHILLLSERVEHLKLLYKMLLSEIKDKRIYLVTGSLGNVTKIKLDQPCVVLSTSKYVGEGLDLPELDTLFITLPFSWKGNTKQYLGRLERGLDKKDELRVFDYIDMSDDMFLNMYKKRLSIYKQAGYELVLNTSGNEYQSQYFDYRDYFSTWKNDLAQATSIYMRMKNVTLRLINELLEINTKADITLVVPDRIFKKIQGKVEKIKLLKTEQVGNNICIFNDEIYWYGDLNFGDVVKPYMTAVRVYSTNLVRNTKKKR